MDRRSAIGALTFLIFGFCMNRPANANQFSDLIVEYEQTPGVLENAWRFREQGAFRGVGRGTPSTRAISRRAIDLIIQLEVGGQKRYDAKYTKPIWPRGESGVTIGIGYDLRFSNQDILYRDWKDIISQENLIILSTALGAGGQNAEKRLSEVQGVEIPWQSALTQFSRYIPYLVAETERAFPNTKMLSDDSLGALASLIYNRGSSMERKSPRRAEMVAIYDLMLEQKFSEVPEQLRKMKRLWTTPDSRGLVIRRELEALLYEEGLQQ
ncbi:hypothetical protein Xaut_3730 [Xanthobacter versatilis]|uniref:Uncharacterized protein n=1 Tax=Xanthobacter autotrophicus (strain ATCC BAA-1158 / Py2) TaxID=78245 RepID=A7ILR3_XANP2|nr:hypothetical protein Xaut_3730 [Xanthobacter autotrophicus Py2]